MKKIQIISTLVLSIFMLSSCGFKALNQKNKNQINIANIKISGEERVSYTLKNNILLFFKEKSEKKYNAVIKLKKVRESRIKNKSGKTIRYRINMTANLELTSLADDSKKQKTFLTSADYDISKIHIDTISNENRSIKSAVQILSDNIIDYIILTTRN